MEKKIIIYSLLFIFLISFASSTMKVGDDEFFEGINIIPPIPPINYSLFPTVNSSDWWNGYNVPTDIPNSEFWVNDTLIIFDIHNDTWDNSFLNIWNYNQTLATFNTWGKLWANHTLTVFDLWNPIWVSTYNETYDAKPDIDRFYNWSDGAGATDDFATTGTSNSSNMAFEKVGNLILQKNPDYDEDFVFGSYQLNDTTNSLHDNRMWFDKSKGAFRVGMEDSTNWDDGNVGLYSMGLGYRPLASGTLSVAMGYEPLASGTASTAMGSGTEASGGYSVAMGSNTKASSSYTVAMGSNTEASNFNAVAMGYSSKAAGHSSVAMGYQTIATGEWSVAMGGYTVADSRYGVVFGRYNAGGGKPTSTVATDPLFEFGTGTSASQVDNVMTILKNHQAYISNLNIIDPSSLGNEKLTNGGFTEGTTGWTLNTGWTPHSGYVSKDGDGTGTLLQTSANMTTPLVIGEYYRLSYRLWTWTTGTVTPACGGVTLPQAGAVRYYTAYFRATTTDDLTFTPSNTARFIMASITLKKITDGDLVVLGDGEILGNLTVAGNIGINTTSPTHKLNVVGDVNITGDLIVDTGTLFVDKTYNRIGINTNIPAYTLDIRGGHIMLENTYGYGMKDTIGQGAYILKGGADDYTWIIPIRTARGVKIMNFAESVALMTILEGGNVGIGTPTPTHTLNVAGDLNITKNATFEKDVIIDGILFGGSPVKIDGINVTNNLFSLEENRNSSLRFFLKNTNSGTNATTIISTENDVGGTMNIGTGSSNFMIGEKSYKNITALFSRSRGKTVFANFYNQMFLWLYNPSDDNDPNNLVELMRLDENGLNVSGNITFNQFYAEMWFHNDSASGNPTTISSQDEWYNITGFNQVEDSGQSLNGFTFSGHKLTTQISGLYKIDYSISFGGGVNDEYRTSVGINGISQGNIETHRKLSAGGDVGNTGSSGFISLNTGDIITLMILNDDAAADADVHSANINLLRAGD